MELSKYPAVADPERVGTYDAPACAGGGFVWDEVLEYRVWLHPERGAPDAFDGNDYYHAFGTFEDALEFYRSNSGAEEPIALLPQREHINESKPGVYEHITIERITEWPHEFLSRPKRTPNTIPDFLSPNAPPNRIDIIRGIVSR